MRLLDRYLLRNFAEPFLLCFFGFIAIWLVVDLFDNINDFIQYHTPFKLVARYYLSQVPAVVLLSIPVALLLALLFALSKMSRHNEIISMLTAGCSVTRVLLPLILVGAALSGVCLVLNREWAPHAEALKKRMQDAITHGEQRAEDRLTVEGYLFRNRQDARTWFIQRFRPNTDELEGVHISQEDAHGNVIRKWYAVRAVFQPQTHTWVLLRGMCVDLDPSGKILKIDPLPLDAEHWRSWTRKITDWNESPWRIAAGQMEAQNLSTTELKDYLRYNSDFPAAQLAPFRTQLGDRYAFPLSCLVVVFIGAPLGIVFNRRGVLASVAGSIFIFFAMILLHFLSLGLGRTGHLTPILAAWLPDVLFAAAGMILLYMRATNREFRNLLPWT